MSATATAFATKDTKNGNDIRMVNDHDSDTKGLTKDTKVSNGLRHKGHKGHKERQRHKMVHDYDQDKMMNQGHKGKRWPCHKGHKERQRHKMVNDYDQDRMMNQGHKGKRRQCHTAVKSQIRCSTWNMSVARYAQAVAGVCSGGVKPLKRPPPVFAYFAHFWPIIVQLCSILDDYWQKASKSWSGLFHVE